MPIQLNAANILTVTLGGSTIDTQDTISVVAASVDLVGGNVSVSFSRGTPASNSFVPSLRSPSISSFILNTTTGNWSFNGTTGTLTSQQLTAINNNQKTFKNGIEGLVNALGLITGTVVPWA